MRTVKVKVEGITPYSSSKNVEVELLKGETLDDHEKRRWREKAHVDVDGQVFIPGVSFKMALDETAALLNEKIKGKGNQTWTKVLSTGTVAMTDMFIGIHVDELKAKEIYCNSDGVRGSGKRVYRWFPYTTSWNGEVEFQIFNDAITQDVFERFFTQAGLLAGVGRGRPIQKCPAGNGRFKPVSFTWADS